MFNSHAIHWTVKMSPLRKRLLKDDFSENGLFNDILSNIGWGNGYVHIHKDLVDVDFDRSIILHTIYVHGGITFDEFSDNYYVFGFDTSHYGDNLSKWSKEDVEKETISFYERILRYYELKYVDNRAKLVLASQGDEHEVSIALARIKSKMSFFLPNKELHLLKKEEDDGFTDYSKLFD